MRVTFLGTGSAMPAPDRVQSGLLLSGGTEPLLVDCGSGILHQLERTNASYEAIETVLLTHHHLDHVSDLMPLLKARWLAGEERLTVVGPEGTEDLLDGLLSVHDYMQDRLDLTIREVTPGSFELAGYDIEAMETRHSMDCLAYNFEGAFAFSGDSEAFPELVEFADGAAILAHDCSFPDGVEVSNHPTPSKLGEALAAADAEVGRVYLTHLYPHTSGRTEEMVDSVQEHWDGDVRVAQDGMTIRIDRA